MNLDGDDRRQIEALTVAMRDLRVELRALRRGELVATLTEAEREEIAYRVYELIDARLAPRDTGATDPAPRRAGK